MVRKIGKPDTRSLSAVVELIYVAIDVYNWKNRMDCVTGHIKSDPKIPEHTRDLILKYKTHMVASGNTPARVIRKLWDLQSICRRWLPPGKELDCLTKDEVKEILAQLECTNLAEATKVSFKVTFRMFYTWAHGGITVPEEVSWFKVTMKHRRTKLPDELLTEDDVAKLINAEPYARQRAMLAILYESGCRIGEILSLMLKSISFDEYGAQLLVHGKTGYRRVRIIASVPYLVEWMNIHPHANDPDAPLWCKMRGSGQMMNYANVRTLFKRTARRAGVTKKVNPHNFRHSRATALAKHLTEAQMKEYLGWVQASEMAGVYVHLSGRDVDGALLQMYGMKTDSRKDETRLKPRVCQKCHETNGFAAKLCKRCGTELKENETIITEHISRQDADSLLDKMINDPQFKSMFIEKMKSVLTENNRRPEGICLA